MGITKRRTTSGPGWGCSVMALGLLVMLGAPVVLLAGFAFGLVAR